LYNNLPLTNEQLQKSNDSIQQALFEAGKIYIQEIEDCVAGTESLEQLRNRYPQFTHMDEVLFNLYYCYNKNGETAKAAAIKKLLAEKFPSSKYTTIVTTGKDPQSASNPDATLTYEKIYDLFIEGKFDEALAQKKLADSQYGKNYWTPQLLYIEAVYHIKQRDDASAKTVLNNLIAQFSTSPLAAKAVTLLDVLGRRNQIEEDLRKMVVTRKDDGVTSNNPPIVNPVSKPAVDTTTKKPVSPPVNKPVNPPAKDTTTTKPVIPVRTSFVYSANESQYVVLILNKVDPVFSNEAKNAFFRYNRETFYNKTYSVDLQEIDADNRVLLIAPFKDEKEALDYIDKTKPKTASEIIPWLKGGKYSFSIITTRNLDILKTEKNVEEYKNFLNLHLPGKF
jgi:outer membrane protein assembly factor BamD (BamD/ComL family)